MSLLRKCKLCIDVSHSALWGYDPVESIKRYKDQLIYVHLQDYANYSGGEGESYDVNWVDVGSGTVMDFPKIMTTLEDIGYDRWVTACPGQIEDRSDQERMQVNRGYLQQLGY
jgi:sugar phosphate isomerase/epimerase